MTPAERAIPKDRVSKRAGRLPRAWGPARSGTLRSIGLALLLALAASPAPGESTGEIRVKVVGLKSDEGDVRWGLYNKKETFATSEGPIKKGAQPIKNGQAEFVIPNLPHGTYAVIVGHDVNRDGKVSRNPFSAELKGISNYTSKILSFPDFDKAKFKLAAPRMTLEIHVY